MNRTWRLVIALLVEAFLILPILALLYWTIVAEGVRAIFPFAGQRLSKLPIPGLAVLDGYEGPHKWDLAHLFALVLLAFVWLTWVRVFRTLLGPEAAKASPPGGAGDGTRASEVWVVGVLAIVLIVGDSIIFFCGVRSQESGDWGGGTTAVFPSLVLTMLYLAILVSAAYFTVKLFNRKEEDR